MCLIVSFLNFAGIIFDEQVGVLLLSCVTNIILVAHYLMESIHYRDIRVEFLFLFGFFLIMNLIWTFREVHKYAYKNTTVIRKDKMEKPEENIYMQGLRETMSAPIEAREVY
jgi:hypothetical protein